MADDFNPEIRAFRKGESQPLRLSKKAIIREVMGIVRGLDNGMPKIGADNYGDKVLLEGREDAGYNKYNINNPRAVELANKSGSGYAAAVLDKSEVAKRLNIPFELAWNGTGKTAEADGQRHATRAEQMKGAVNDPKNKEFKDLIDRGLKGEFTQAEKASVKSYGEILKAITKFPGEIVRDNVYTTEAKASMQETLDQTIKESKLTAKREEAVRKDLPHMAELMNIVPSYYRSSQGAGGEFETRTLRSQGISKFSPDTISILDKIIGNVDTDSESK